MDFFKKWTYTRYHPIINGVSCSRDGPLMLGFCSSLVETINVKYIKQSYGISNCQTPKISKYRYPGSVYSRMMNNRFTENCLTDWQDMKEKSRPFTLINVTWEYKQHSKLTRTYISQTVNHSYLNYYR